MLNVSNETPGTGIGVLITAFEPLERIEIIRANVEALSACATWREDREGSPKRCGLIVRSTGSIFAGRPR
ncbi:hypothetical protein X768_28010 [Mesorhizobium sp. LSJC265A00]|uniref:hypothetical protein n=1 Tax=Mesorhizobium sp. L103C131B0 TaxID=1287089 RepID=UPI0003CF54CD|nr:hypothetical protein [Mesorhizobium sp. L103C131B0]ESX05189.1 hypothetical protein X768_28010 [Mesorhizobium sp. LSJC265A00]ESX15645.1 hypothetical protein X766_25620 [Mesorhizobium sp. LSJC255A00]ESZ54110.1 hypothetical protein X729_29695 [Mesorhizobium sp. L103C131B0]